MNEELQITLESRIQELLAGQSGQAETAELLAVIARDDDARRILSDMVELQRQSRRSLGCDVDADDLQTSIAGTIDSLRSMRSATVESVRTQRKRRGRSVRILIGRIAWPIRAAAMVVIGVSVFLAVTARHDSRMLRDQLARMDRTVTFPKPTTDELAGMRLLWKQLSEGSGDSRPWVFLSNGTGQFAYVPSDRHAADTGGLVLLRCMIVGEDKQGAMRMNLLLPARQAVRLTVPEAGRLVGQPVQLTVSSSNEWAGMGLKVGDGPAGVQGRVQIGGGAAEIGQFRLDGQKMKVFLQAMTLNGEVI